MPVQFTWLSEALRRYYGNVVRKPLSWTIINVLTTLEEEDEKKSGPSSAGGPRTPGQSFRADEGKPEG